MTNEVIGAYLILRICPICHAGILEQHLEFHNFLKCPICSFSRIKVDGK